MMLYFMSALYIVAGSIHFLRPKFYKPMMPPYIPYHDFCIFISGVIEIALGLLLLIPKTQSLAAWGVIAFLVAVMPVHINMIQERKNKFKNINPIFLYTRPFGQLILAYWAFLYT